MAASSSAYKMIETAVNLIQAEIKAKISAALAAQRAIHDPDVTTEPPKEYFIYEGAQTYRPPAVFTIAKNTDIRDPQMNPNFIDAAHDILCAVVVEDRVERLVTIKSWRYQAALMQILHQTTLTNPDQSVKLVIRVQSCDYSEIVSQKSPGAPDAQVFRKEVSLRLHVEHYEALQGV